jgi:hypothetical protein
VQIIKASRAQRQQRQETAAQDTAPAEVPATRATRGGAGHGGDDRADVGRNRVPRLLGGQAAVEEKRVRKGVLPGSFVTLLEAWKSKYEGEAEVSDDLVGRRGVPGHSVLACNV